MDGQNLNNVTVESRAEAIASKPPATPIPENLPEAERIQRLIIDYFFQKLNSELPTTLQPKDNSSRRAQFLHALRTDEISTTDEIAYLSTLPAPISELGARRIFDNIASNILEKQILAVLTGYNSTNWEDVLASDLDNFLAAPRRGQPDYRTPVGFADLRRRFLLDIKDEATPEQLDNYIKAMDDLETNLYGARFTHYREFENLRKEARALSENIDKVALETPDPSVAEPAPTPAPTADATADVALAVTSEERREQLLSHALIEGDAWRQSGQDYFLSVPTLISAGVVPYFEVVIEDQQFYLSSLFELTSGQMASLAFIPSPNGVKVRSFYREKNEALWHYLPDYIRDISGEGIALYGEGFNERSTILPALLQAALNQIELNRNILDLSATNPDFLFAGTAYAYNTRQDYRDAFSRGLLRGDFYHEVSSTAYNADSGAIITPGRRKSAPQLLSINSNVAPNFSNLLTRYSVYSAFAGDIVGASFRSNDEQTSWLFYNDYRGRCWVANIETNSPLTTTGCRREWLLPTDISTPLYELSRLADGYGDASDTRMGNYISMWNNYLSKVPLIAEYSKLISKPVQSA